MTLNQGLLFAYHFDCKGHMQPLSAEEALRWDGRGFVWMHLSRDFEDAVQWLEQDAWIDPVAVEAMLAHETRPRLLELEQGLLVVLRGLNLNPGADPEDMVSLRLFIDQHRLITVRIRKLTAVDEFRQKLERGKPPNSVGDLVAQLARAIFVPMVPLLEGLEDELDDVEEKLLNKASNKLQLRLSEHRLRAMQIRRYLLPQREVFQQLAIMESPYLARASRPQFRELLELLTRMLEHLDAERERVAILQEEIKSRLSEHLSRNTYILSIMAAIFLPLNFVTSLLGINVGGIPGAENDNAFWIVAGTLIGILLLEISTLRKNRWF